MCFYFHIRKRITYILRIDTPSTFPSCVCYLLLYIINIYIFIIIIIPRSGCRILTAFPFDKRCFLIDITTHQYNTPFKWNLPISQDRLTHVQLLFTWNLSPLQSSKFSFEYLLLPPRSALESVPLALTSRNFVTDSTPSYTLELSSKQRCSKGQV